MGGFLALEYTLLLVFIKNKAPQSFELRDYVQLQSFLMVYYFCFTTPSVLGTTFYLRVLRLDLVDGEGKGTPGSEENLPKLTKYRAVTSTLSKAFICTETSYKER